MGSRGFCHPLQWQQALSLSGKGWQHEVGSLESWPQCMGHTDQALEHGGHQQLSLPYFKCMNSWKPLSPMSDGLTLSMPHLGRQPEVAAGARHHWPGAARLAAVPGVAPQKVGTGVFGMCAEALPSHLHLHLWEAAGWGLGRQSFRPLNLRAQQLLQCQLESALPQGAHDYHIPAAAAEG